ncbi:hypothetical protein Taro_047372 [Colocasia esculenta]|uniref:VOC domain-containing protein n=1 Tax=Colocasia esculenta TaxID=4460 RepID=A0A843X727_COLES|nr:hypothetical protein [Colocasia esculenta]
MGVQKEASPTPSVPLQLTSLNHVSFLCESVDTSAHFYEQVLGFVPIKRPSSFDFEGAWLFNYGIGIHLIERSSTSEPRTKPAIINPKANHISFQCADTDLVKRRLEEMGIDYVSAVVKEGVVEVGQLFFHDPDGYMVEICDCQKLPVRPLSPVAACPLKIPRANSNTNRMPTAPLPQNGPLLPVSAAETQVK